MPNPQLQCNYTATKQRSPLRPLRAAFALMAIYHVAPLPPAKPYITCLTCGKSAKSVARFKREASHQGNGHLDPLAGVRALSLLQEWPVSLFCQGRCTQTPLKAVSRLGHTPNCIRPSLFWSLCHTLWASAHEAPSNQCKHFKPRASCPKMLPKMPPAPPPRMHPRQAPQILAMAKSVTLNRLRDHVPLDNTLGNCLNQCDAENNTTHCLQATHVYS